MLNPLEHPWLLMITGIVVMAVGGWMRQNTTSEKGLPILLAGIAVAVGAFGIDYVFKTDNEQIRHIIDIGSKAAVQADASLLKPYVSSQYRDSAHPNKAALLRRLESTFALIALQQIHFRSLVVNVRGRQAECLLDMAIFPDPKQSVTGGGMYFVRVAMQLKKESVGQWMLANAEVKSVNDTPFEWGQVP